MMPIISEAYQHQNETNRFHSIFLASASALSIILLVILFLLFKQMKKLNKAKQDIDLNIHQLSELNKELYVLMKIKRNNFTLTETNLLKKIHWSLYGSMFRLYKKLEVYRRKLNLMATTGK
jgi:hypothetical protein